MCQYHKILPQFSTCSFHFFPFFHHSRLEILWLRLSLWNLELEPLDHPLIIFPTNLRPLSRSSCLLSHCNIISSNLQCVSSLFLVLVWNIVLEILTKSLQILLSLVLISKSYHHVTKQSQVMPCTFWLLSILVWNKPLVILTNTTVTTYIYSILYHIQFTCNISYYNILLCFYSWKQLTVCTNY